MERRPRGRTAVWRAVAAYYVLTFAISWGGVLLLVDGPARLVDAPTPTPELFVRGVLVTLAGPPVAGLLLTALTAGREGLRDLASRILSWRVGVRWYAIAILAAPLSVTAALLALMAGDAAFRPG